VAEFQDIKITGFDEASSGPSGEGTLMRMVLRLSDKAPLSWCDYFDAGWKSHHYMMKRRATAHQDSITVICLPDELQGQINELKPIVAQCNTAYREMLAAHEAQQAAARRDAQARRDALANLKGTLDFD
jgi:hypothetical protein